MDIKLWTHEKLNTDLSTDKFGSMNNWTAKYEPIENQASSILPWSKIYLNLILLYIIWFILQKYYFWKLKNQI